MSGNYESLLVSSPSQHLADEKRLRWANRHVSSVRLRSAGNSTSFTLAYAITFYSGPRRHVMFCDAGSFREAIDRAMLITENEKRIP